MRPLEGIRVIDLSRLLPGPMCSWYLCGLGAEVVKVESPGGGDYLRHSPPRTPSGEGAWFAALHAGKKSVVLDLKQSSHCAALRALLGSADVLIEGYRPGTMARLGLSPQSLRVEFPRLVIASITGFGQDGPLRDRPGHDLGFQALAGTLSLGRPVDGVPPVPAVPVGDIGGGALTAAMRICAALHARGKTGEGAWIDASMTEGTLAMLAPQVAGMSATGRNPVPGGELLTGANPRYRSYRCRDGRFLAVAALEDKFWATLCDRIGRAVEPDESALEQLFLENDRDEWAAMLGPACCEPVLQLDELATHPLHVSRRSLTALPDGLRVSHPVPDGHTSACRPSPALGEHTESDLARVGFDPSRLKEKQ